MQAADPDDELNHKRIPEIEKVTLVATVNKGKQGHSAQDLVQL